MIRQCWIICRMSQSDQAAENEIQDVIIHRIAVLELHEQDYVRYRFGLDDGVPHSIREASKALGLSNEKCLSLEKSIKKRLKEDPNGTNGAKEVKVSGKSGDATKRLKELFEEIEGVSVKENKEGTFHFPFYYSNEMDDISIDTLELGTRSSNTLRNAGIRTIGELAIAVSEGMDLKALPKCGKTSVREIMVKLFLYQYDMMGCKGDRADYLFEVIAWNETKKLK